MGSLRFHAGLTEAAGMMVRAHVLVQVNVARPLSGTKRSADDMDTDMDSDPEAAQAEPAQQPQLHVRHWRERPLQAQQPAAAPPAAAPHGHASQVPLGSSGREVSAPDLPALHTTAVRGFVIPAARG